MIAPLQTRLGEDDKRKAEADGRAGCPDRGAGAAAGRLLANSSQPPSADGPDKPAPKSLRARSGRKPGGQPGREGRTLRQVAVPDEVVVHEPGACAGCGGPLPGD